MYQRIITLLIFLLISLAMTAQHSTLQNIIKKHQKTIELFNGIYAVIDKAHFDGYYTTAGIELKGKEISMHIYGLDTNGIRQTQIYFEIDVKGDLTTVDIYWSNRKKQIEEIIEKTKKEKKLIDSNQPAALLYFFFQSSTTKHVDIAERIATEALKCHYNGSSHMNNYYTPFNDVYISASGIKLKLSDRHNSRLLGATTYSLWDLELCIVKDPEDTLWVDYTIGSLQIRFWDSSINKDCGESIRRKIEEEQKNYKK